MQALLDAIAAAPLHRDAQRIFHGRGGLHPGCEHWTLDVYPPVWLLTSFQPVGDDELVAVGAALERRQAELAPGEPLIWVFQCRQDSGRVETRVMAGAVPEPHHVSEGGSSYVVQLPRGQNHGLFLDMAEGRRWVAGQAAAKPGMSVLNLFAYTCAFSVVALRAGAGKVVNIDMASGPLSTGRANHRLNGVEAGASFFAHDVFVSWAKIARGGPYDLIVLDPPSHQKGSFMAEKDWPRLMRRLPGLLAPGGRALLCLNTPKLGVEFLTAQMTVEAPELAFVERLANPPAFADADAERALKVLVYAKPG